jgi:hypothetical protein
MFKRYFSSFKMLKQLAGAAAIGLLVMDVGATMAGKVFCDLNGNGIFDSGDEGIAGVIVRHCDKIKVTDANGDYSFDATDINTAICNPPQGTSTQPRIVTVDTSTVTGDCNMPCSPTSVEVPVIPAFGINFCFTKRTPPPPTNPGTGTPGFWKNHPEAWPADAIEIGGQVYTKEQAIYLMQHPTKTDKTYNMFEQLVAAVLNVEIGNSDSCIAGTIIAADDWMAAHPVGSGVKADSSDWTSISTVFLRLDDYNNGLLCAPPRD